jgi:ribose transport system substrate-binding protein
MKDKFLSIAGHDLKTPFAAILGYIEFILMDKDLSTKNREFVKIIENSAKTQLKYIQDILSILKIEAGEFKLNITKTSFLKCIEPSVDLLDILAIKKDISIYYDKDAEIFKSLLSFDLPKITQVVNNLISNAIKFTNRGGEIKIDCLKNSRNEFEFHCIDNGVGITKEKIDFLFTHYNQTHTYGTEDEAGTGLGLSICKKIVNLHGGDVYVRSTLGKGSDFWFTIPIDLNDKEV